jgi:lipopolysaccharide export LptBFGC system permease protein LptF
MVFTLHRYIFRELLRIFILATVALTLILSLGGILRPVQEYGVGPRQAVHILVYFLPITLTFVLPMAALFASALAYGRFAGDNELDACRASGISMLTLVYPGMILAVLVAIANLLLSFHVMPHFVHMAEASLKSDAKQILFRNIQRRGHYRIPGGGYMIYADHADLRRDTLHGIVIVQATPDGIKEVITSDETVVKFDLRDEANLVQLIVRNCRRIGRDSSFHVELLPVTKEFGSLLGDSVKFKKIDEMKRIRADLMRFDPIARLAHAVHTQLLTELLARDIGQVLDAGKSYELRDGVHSVRFAGSAGQLQGEATIALVPPPLVEEYDGRSGRLRRLVCERAEITVAPAPPRRDLESAGESGLNLYLMNPRVEETGQRLVHHSLANLAMPERVAARLRGRSTLQVATGDLAAWLGEPPSAALAGQQAELLRRIAGTLTAIEAELNSRLVFGIGCVPMILIGIALGILQRGGHLLSAFGASCLPAAVLIVAIVSGKQFTKNANVEGSSGILIMWAGLAFLLILAALLYRKLRRG